MHPRQMEWEKRSFWRDVFLNSKVNGACYRGEQLPGRRWDWPKNTFLQRRLQAARAESENHD